MFAFGILAYEMLAGRPPFGSPPCWLALSGQPLPEPARLTGADIPRSLGDVVVRCLAEAVAERPDVRAVLSAMR
jgi:serine/threonine protein kinase